MKNNRNTLADQWKGQRSISNSLERKTMTNPQSNIPNQNQKQMSQAQLNQRMTSNILAALLKIPNQGNRSSLSNSLQPKTSTMINTISSFMNSIDHQFEKNYLDIDSIPQLLNFWGYPHSYNKSVFQSIGAPHTWGTCLQMMEFFAQISNYFFEYRLHQQEYQGDRQQIDIILQTILTGNNRYRQHLQQIYEKLAKQQQQYQYKLESNELILRNIKNSQKSIVQLQQQEKLLKQRLQREKQIVIQFDQQNQGILAEIQVFDEKIEQLLREKSNMQKKLQSLTEEINQQQISVEDAHKMEIEIKQYRKKISKLQQEYLDSNAQYQNDKKQIVEQFYQNVDDINQIKSSVKQYSHYLETRHIPIVVPQVDHVAFTEAIHKTEDITILQQSLSKIIDNEKIKSMLISQQSVADILEHQSKQLKAEKKDLLSKKSRLQGQGKDLIEQINKLEHYFQQLNTQIHKIQENSRVLQEKIIEKKLKVNKMKEQKNCIQDRNTKMKEETKLRKQSIKQGIRLLKDYEKRSNQMIVKMEQKQQQAKRKVSEILQKVANGFTNLTQQVKGLM